jgi:hypothetical protein
MSSNLKRYLFSISTTLVFGLVIYLISCDESDTDSDENNSSESLNKDTESDTCGDDSFSLVLDEAHNYSFSSEVDIKTFEIQEYPNIPLIDWSGITTDTLGHAIDPAVDVGHVEIIVWNLKEYETFEQWLNQDSLDMDYLEGMVNLHYTWFENGATSARLSDFGSFGEDVDAEEYFDSQGRWPTSEYIYVLVVGRGSQIGYDAIMSAFLKPVSSTDAPTDFYMTSDTVSLTYSVTLNETPFPVPRQAADATIDWREMIGKPNPFGQEFTESQVGRVMLTFYQGKTLAELQPLFLDLELIADIKYEAEPINPKPMPFSDLQDDTGEQFSAFGDEEGTWMLSLWCTVGCNNPAPRYVASLIPCH